MKLNMSDRSGITPTTLYLLKIEIDGSDFNFWRHGSTADR